MTNVATKVPEHYRPAPILNSAELHMHIQSTFKQIVSFITENDLEIENLKENTGAYNISTLRMLAQFNYAPEIQLMSKTGKKKLSRFILQLNRHMTINKINSFISFIARRFQTELANLHALKIRPSKQEQSIIASRTKFKELKSQMQLAHKDYLDKKKLYYSAGKKYMGS